MKRILISMAALLAVVGCAKQENLVSADFGATGTPEFTASIETSRVTISKDDEGYKLSWTNDDRLSIFFNEGGNSEFRFDGETGTTSGKIVAVEGNIKDGELLDTFYGVYPYGENNSLSGDVLSLTLPAVQQYTKDTFAPGANTMIGNIREKEKFNFQFHNLCGYIRLDVTGVATITSIELKGNNDEILAGAATYDISDQALALTGEGKTITMDCGEGVALSSNAKSFWIVVPPTTFENGLTVTLTDSEGNSMEKVLEKPFTVERNAVYTGKVSYSIIDNDTSILLDITFDADGAVNNGTISGIVIQDYNHSTIQVGDKYVGKFIKPNDSDQPQTEGFYYINYADNEEFKVGLVDGFTMEVILRPEFVSIDRFAKPLGTDMWGLNMDKNFFWWDNPCEWEFYANKPVKVGMDGLNGSQRMLLGSYEQIVLTYDIYTQAMVLYANGRVSAVDTIGELEVGHALAIGAGAFNTCDGTAVDRFNGEIYALRIHGASKNEEQVKALYEEALPTLQSLNKEILDEMPNLVFDLRFDADGNATDVAGDTTFNKHGESTVAPAPAGWTESEYVGEFKENGYFILNPSEELLNTLNTSFTVELITTNYRVDKYQCPISTDSWSIVLNRWVNYEVWLDDAIPDWKNWYRLEWCRYAHKPNEYYHLILSYDKEEKRTIVSVNGWPGFYHPTVPNHAGGIAYNPTTRICVGCNYGEFWDQPYAGDIVSLKIYDRALNREEIGARYRHFYDEGTLDALNANFVE